MNEPATMHNGPLGSTIHALRADAESVAALAAVDWSRHFRRVCGERREAVTRIVRRRQHTGVRVREEEGAYAQGPREPAATVASRQGPGRTEHRTRHG